MKSILVPIAPERRPSHLNRAVWLAQRSDAEIILLCVAPDEGQPVQTILAGAWHGQIGGAPDVPVRLLSATGDPVRQILNVARREHVDLIVLGLDQKWHAERGWREERAFQRFLRKSTVANVVQETPCPVWLEKSSTAGSSRLSCLLCFLDLKINAEGLLRSTTRIAEIFEARMLLFHSIGSADIFGPGQPRHVVESKRYLIEIAERKIDRLQARCSTSAPRIVEAGDDVSLLNRISREIGADVVVIGRTSSRWGDNDEIYEIVRHGHTSVMIHVDPENLPARVDRYAVQIHPVIAVILALASLALALSIIFWTVYFASHHDNCRLAPIRCQIPPDFLFYSPQDSED